ncbi:MAG: DegV family protein, partial [Oscillospiraceae bacterium]|nr:DegV family protein [Oscillospiraceae bacterium]
TSQLNPQEFVEFWRPLLSQGLPIVHIALGSGVSGTWHNGVTASEMLREEFPDAQIFVIDSTLCSTGYGILALKAAEMRDAGATAAQCADWLEAHKINVHAWYTTDDLLYLRRSGRCSKASAVIGTALHICPVLNLDSAGHLIVQERVRGMKRSMNRMAEIIADRAENAAAQTLYISHTDALDKAREFGALMMEKCPFQNIFYGNIGTIIGANCGPGLFSVFFLGKPRTMDGYDG